MVFFYHNLWYIIKMEVLNLKLSNPVRLWFRSLFFKCLLGIMGIFILGSVILFSIIGLIHYSSLRREMAPASLEAGLRSGLEQIGPQGLLARAESHLCDEHLQLLIPIILDHQSRVWMRYNRSLAFNQKMDVVIRYQGINHQCQYPVQVATGLPDQFAETEQRAVQTGKPAHFWLDDSVSNRWISVISLPLTDPPSTVVTLGINLDSSFLGMMFPQEKAVDHLLIDLAIISLMSSLLLAAMVVRRIRRAEQAADAWSRGELAVRINDRSQDEFGRLAAAFDNMADALGKTMEVRQSLAVAEERNRLARDLHDTAKQRCFALGLRLSVLAHSFDFEPKQAEMIRSAMELVKRLQQDLSDIINRFYWPTIAQDGFRQATFDSLDLLLGGSSINWVLELDPADEGELEKNPQWAWQLLLFTTEAAANVLKHSLAHNLTVSFSRRDKQGILTVKDDGQGFNPSEVSGPGMGLSSLRQRAEALPNGHLTLISSPGQGTTLILIFDLGGN